jgi:hypothetical protein
MYDHYKGTRFDVWIKIIVDPHAPMRGFSILGREMRVVGYSPVDDVMEDFDGNQMPGKFWVVRAEEIYRVIPELKRYPRNTKDWFLPFEFCETFVRPNYYLDAKVIEKKLQS